jgi:hypothetical protein
MKGKLSDEKWTGERGNIWTIEEEEEMHFFFLLLTLINDQDRPLPDATIGCPPIGLENRAARNNDSLTRVRTAARGAWRLHSTAAEVAIAHRGSRLLFDIESFFRENRKWCKYFPKDRDVMTHHLAQFLWFHRV